MNFCKISLLLCLQLIFVYCNKLENITDAAAAFEKSTSSSLFARKARATYDFVYADLIGCAVQSDPSCLVNVAEDFLSIKKNELLSQADQEVMKATGRSDPTNSPSELTKTMEKLIADLTGLFKNGISSFFRDSDDTTSELADGDNDEIEENKDNDNQDVGESRVLTTKKKKKKKPLKKFFTLLKVGILTGIVFLKVCLLIKIFEAGLKFKLFLVTLGSVLIQAFKFYMDFKSKNSHDSGVVYNSPHESGIEWSGPGISDEYHARAANRNYAQNLAYSSYKS